MPDTTEMVRPYTERADEPSAARAAESRTRALKLTIRWAAVLFCIAAWGGALYFIAR